MSACANSGSSQPIRSPVDAGRSTSAEIRAMSLPVLEMEIGGMLQLALADFQNACFARAPGSNYGRRGSTPVCNRNSVGMLTGFSSNSSRQRDDDQRLAHGISFTRQPNCDPCASEIM